MPSSRMPQFQPPSFSGMFSRPPPATLALMVVTGVLSILSMASMGWGGGSALVEQLLFSPAQVLGVWRIWTAVTYLFVVLEPIALLFYVGFGLWMFASQLERQWGSRRFLLYFFATGTGAALVMCVLALVLPSLHLVSPLAFPGHYAATEAVIVAWVLMNWQATVFLWFFPVRAPVLLLLSLILPVLSLISGNWQPALHVLSAMGIGYLLMNKSFSPRRAWLMFRAWWIDRQLKRRARRFHVVPRPPTDDHKGSDHYLH